MIFLHISLIILLISYILLHNFFIRKNVQPGAVSWSVPRPILWWKSEQRFNSHPEIISSTLPHSSLFITTSLLTSDTIVTATSNSLRQESCIHSPKSQKHQHLPPSFKNTSEESFIRSPTQSYVPQTVQNPKINPASHSP